jgi:hypothetical protein
MSGWQRYLRDLQGPVPDELTGRPGRPGW